MERSIAAAGAGPALESCNAMSCKAARPSAVALPAPAGVRATSIVAGRDLLVQPVESAHCPFGEVVRFQDLGHLELLFRPEVFAAVLAALRS